MNPAARIRLRGWLLVFAVAQACAGCGAIMLARGTPGIDVSQIQPGVTRTQAEAVLGKPQKDWISHDGIHYFTYEYDTGRPPDIPDAAAFVFMDLLTLGIWEVMMATVDHDLFIKTLPPPTFARVVISYDDSDMVRGIFGEFDTLPADGHCGPYSWRK